MVTTQKLTAFAFAYYDGMKKLEKLSADQKGQAIKYEFWLGRFFKI